MIPARGSPLRHRDRRPGPPSPLSVPGPAGSGRVTPDRGLRMLLPRASSSTRQPDRQGPGSPHHDAGSPSWPLGLRTLRSLSSSPNLQPGPLWPAEFRDLPGMLRASGPVGTLRPRRPVARQGGQAGALQAGVSSPRRSAVGSTFQVSSLARLVTARRAFCMSALRLQPMNNFIRATSAQTAQHALVTA